MVVVVQYSFDRNEQRKYHRTIRCYRERGFFL